MATNRCADRASYLASKVKNFACDPRLLHVEKQQVRAWCRVPKLLPANAVLCCWPRWICHSGAWQSLQDRFALRSAGPLVRYCCTALTWLTVWLVCFVLQGRVVGALPQLSNCTPLTWYRASERRCSVNRGNGVGFSNQYFPYYPHLHTMRYELLLGQCGEFMPPRLQPPFAYQVLSLPAA